MESWGTERISDILKATQLAHDPVEIWTQTIMNSRVHASNWCHSSHRDKHPVCLAFRGLALGWTLVFLERQLNRERCLSLGSECGLQAGEHGQVTSSPWASLPSLGEGSYLPGPLYSWRGSLMLCWPHTPHTPLLTQPWAHTLKTPAPTLCPHTSHIHVNTHHLFFDRMILLFLFFLRRLHTGFRSGCTNSHSHQ